MVYYEVAKGNDSGADFLGSGRSCWRGWGRLGAAASPTAAGGCRERGCWGLPWLGQSRAVPTPAASHGAMNPPNLPPDSLCKVAGKGRGCGSQHKSPTWTCVRTQMFSVAYTARACGRKGPGKRYAMRTMKANEITEQKNPAETSPPFFEPAKVSWDPAPSLRRCCSVLQGKAARCGHRGELCARSRSARIAWILQPLGSTGGCGSTRRGVLGALLGAQLPALRSAGCPWPCACTQRSHLAWTREPWRASKPWESRGAGQGTEGQRAGGAAAKREVLLVGFAWGGWCLGGRSPSGSAVTSPTSAPSPATSPRQHPAKSSGQA